MARGPEPLARLPLPAARDATGVLRRAGQIRVGAAGATGLSCPTCGRPVVLDPASAHLLHATPVPEHDPDTGAHQAARRIIRRRLDELFPSALIDTSVEFESCDYLADIALVSPRGAKLVVEIADAQRSAERYREIVRSLAAEGVASLWISTMSLFVATKRWPSTMVAKLNLGHLQTAILADTGVLMFAHPKDLQIWTARPHPQALELARAGEPRLGVVECLVRRYPLSQLRMRGGAIQLITEYDPPAPPPGPLSKTLTDKLNRRRQAAQAAAHASAP